MKKDYTITSTIQVSEEQIEDIMDAALSGCTYWANDCQIVSPEDEKPDLFPSEAITKGYKLVIHDSEEDVDYYITLDEFLEALSKTPRFDYEQYDASDAEMVLQMAIFGEVVYG